MPHTISKNKGGQAGEWIQVGVNGYTEGDDTAPSTLYIDPAVETQQLAALMKQSRDDDAVRGALARLKADAEDPTINVMPALIDASRALVTVGESMHALDLSRYLVRAKRRLSRWAWTDRCECWWPKSDWTVTTGACALWPVSSATPVARSSTPGSGSPRTPLRPPPIEEDVDIVGVSMHNGAHLTLAPPAVVASLRAARTRHAGDCRRHRPRRHPGIEGDRVPSRSGPGHVQ